MNEPSDYELLKAAGHSPAKAAEIVLDAGRGDPHSQQWIELIRAPATLASVRSAHPAPRGRAAGEGGERMGARRKRGPPSSGNQAVTREELIAKLEVASGPDRDLDCEIACLVLGYITVPERPWLFYDPADKWHRSRKPPQYTASIDAALTLVPEGCLWKVACAGDDRPGLFDALAMPIKGPDLFAQGAATPALALCIASLRARQQ